MPVPFAIAEAQGDLTKLRFPHVLVVLLLLCYYCFFVCYYVVGIWEMLLHVDNQEVVN